MAGSSDGETSGVVGKGLPPISHVLEPEMHHMSTRIRWFHALGYSVREIAGWLPGVRYQQVRNVVVTIPKRAAREDLPALEVKLREVDDDLEAMDKFAAEQEMGIQRQQARGQKVGRLAGSDSDFGDEEEGE